MLTYNHASYIRQALDSVLMQKVNFTYEVIIGDDCSKDDTSKILMEYQERYPEIIKLILNKENIGVKPNFLNVYNSCKGKYIATLEGDDYWLDCDKLQIQVNLLEISPEISGCFHKVKVYDNHRKEFVEERPKDNFQKEIGNIEELCDKSGNFVPIAALVYKRIDLDTKLVDLFMSGKLICDWITTFLVSSKGPIAFINKAMAVYRVNAGCFSTKTINLQIEEAIEIQQAVDKYFNYEYHLLFEKGIMINFFKLIIFYLRKVDIDGLINTLKQIPNINKVSFFKWLILKIIYRK